MHQLDLFHMITSNPYLCKLGWINSFLLQKVVDGNGKPIPWMTYPAIELLEDRVPYGIKVFEYGCGFGTLWWALRAKRVIAVEHDLKWYEHMLRKIPDNVNLFYRHLIYGGEYCNTLSQIAHVKFNIIVIDGRDRVNCAQRCIQSLSEDGVVVFDNTDREEYIPGRTFLTSSGFKELRLYGIAPMVLDIGSATSIFYKENNCLGI